MNKSHWYDGWFYDQWIAPNQDQLFGQIEGLIQPRSTVIDVGCGTGRLAFSLSRFTEKVVGIDPSLRNIQRARRNLSRNPHPGISFEHKTVRDLLADGTSRFNYAVLTYVLHEVAEADRIVLLHDVALLAEQIIIGDYAVPIAPGWWSVLDEVVEFVAGRDHYMNYKSFVARGGIHGLVAQTSLSVVEEIRHKPRTSHLVVLRLTDVKP
jgi:SAM-dependent methyltransferase